MSAAIADPNGRTIFVDDCAYHIHRDPFSRIMYYVGAFNDCPFTHAPSVTDKEET